MIYEPHPVGGLHLWNKYPYRKGATHPFLSTNLFIVSNHHPGNDGLQPKHHLKANLKIL